ncbi:hypothetical protein MPSEU_000411400 [Mayamaea pseudoterrestris]|nr:hypothetical protein MPSEU_000411400 [Mayamaea pseudoterrestris]
MLPRYESPSVASASHVLASVFRNSHFHCRILALDLEQASLIFQKQQDKCNEERNNHSTIMEALAKLSARCNADNVCTSAMNSRGLMDETNKTIVEMTLEVDYSKHCTTLYKMIEEQDWETVAKFLDTGYWIGSLWADKLTPVEQAKTWVTRFDPEDTTKIKWSQLPLHLAIVIEAPVSIIRRLVETYPKALKCTDDEHMLPFHLAMRHGATDEVVDYLLQGFPDAVNVKGKNSRSALECAMRSRKKARARMLTVFLDKTRGNQVANLELVKTQLDEKNKFLDQLHSQLSKIETAKTQVEDDLAHKINQLLDTKAELESKLEELKHEKESLELSSAKMAGQMQHTKLFHEIETERKIAALEVQKKELEAAERQIQEDEVRLHSNLAVIEMRVGETMSVEDMDALKKDLTSFQTYRLEHTRSRALEDIKSLKLTIHNELEKCQGAHMDEIRAIQQSVHVMEEYDTSKASDEELTELRAELDKLKAALRDRTEAQSLRADLLALKTSLESHVKSFCFHDKETKAELNKTIEAITESHLNELDYTGLVQMRQDVTKLKRSAQEKALVFQAKKDLAEIQTLLAAQIKAAGSGDDLVEKKKAIDSIEKGGLEGKSSEELVSLQIEMINLKEGLKRDGVLLHKKELVTALKKDISLELSSASGKHKHTLNAMKKEIDALDKSNDMDSVRLDTLTKHRQTLEGLTKQRIEAKQIKDELSQLQKLVATQMKQSNAESKRELTAFHRELEQIASQKLDEKNRIEIEAIKANIESIKHQVYNSKEEFFTKLEFNSLKQALEERIESTKGEAHLEFLTMKQTLDSINLETVNVKGKEGWCQLKAEIEALKVDLMRKDLINLKKELVEERTASKNDKQKEGLSRAIDSIKTDGIDSVSLGELLLMKKAAVAYRSQVKIAKKSLFRCFFKRSKKQQQTSAAVTASKQDCIQPFMPPRAPTADEISHTSSEPDSESNASIPKSVRTMSYGNVSGSNLKSASDVENLKSPSFMASNEGKELTTADVMPSSITVEQ